MTILFRIVFFLSLIILIITSIYQYGATALIGVASTLSILFFLLNVTIDPECHKNQDGTIRLRPEALINLLAIQVQKIAESKLKLGVVCISIFLYFFLFVNANSLDKRPNNPVFEKAPKQENLSLQRNPVVSGITDIDNNERDDLLQVAKEQTRDDLYEQALITYKKALDSDPNNAQINARIADAYIGINKLGLAIPYAEQALKKEPNSALTLYVYGDLLLAQKQINKAQQYYLQSMNLAPYNPAPYFKYGYMLLLQKKYDESIVYTRKAVELIPEQFAGDDLDPSLDSYEVYLIYAGELILTGDCHNGAFYMAKAIENEAKAHNKPMPNFDISTIETHCQTNKETFRKDFQAQLGRVTN